MKQFNESIASLEFGNVSVHPYSPFIPEGATRLIIGSIPPERFCLKVPDLHPRDIDFYYGSHKNSFWSLISECAEIPYLPDSPESCKKLLTSLSVGITDIIHSCSRINGSALDKDLRNIKCKNIRLLLSRHGQINELIFTSGFVLKWVQKSLMAKLISVGNHRFELHLQNSSVVYRGIQLYSPSPSALRGMGSGGKEKRLNQYRKVFAFSPN